MMSRALNVIGTELITCSTEPMTGFYRDGCCNTGWQDTGTHTVCAQMTEAFLEFTKNQGNDLSTARPEYNFPGLKPGDFWCLCVLRWREAMMVGLAPKVKLEACHIKCLDVVSLEDLKTHSIYADTSTGK